MINCRYIRPTPRAIVLYKKEQFVGCFKENAGRQAGRVKTVGIDVIEHSSTVINHAETWTPGACRQEQIG